MAWINARLDKYLSETDIVVELPQLGIRFGDNSIDVALVYLAAEIPLVPSYLCSYNGTSFLHEYRAAVEHRTFENRLYFAICVSANNMRDVYFLHHEELAYLYDVLKVIENGRVQDVVVCNRRELEECDKVFASLHTPDPENAYNLIPDPAREGEMIALLEREMSLHEDNIERSRKSTNASKIYEGLFFASGDNCDIALPCVSCAISYTPSAERFPWKLSICASSMRVDCDDHSMWIEPPRETVSDFRHPLTVALSTCVWSKLLRACDSIVVQWQAGTLVLPENITIPEYIDFEQLYPELSDALM